ncbi:hypothetical protein [Pollutimonas nitritireducens]|nr:hypothetical protein [Pollutimonas nitritireducens]
MKSILIAIIISVLSGCGTYSEGSATNYDASYQNEIPSSGNGG